MINKESRSAIRVKKHMRVRNRLAGTTERPRLAVFRSNNHMYAQIIDDSVGKTLVAASTTEKAIKDELPRVLGGFGTAIISTNKGVLTDKEARKQNVGGEVLAFIW